MISPGTHIRESRSHPNSQSNKQLLSSSSFSFSGVVPVNKRSSFVNTAAAVAQAAALNGTSQTGIALGLGAGLGLGLGLGHLQSLDEHISPLSSPSPASSSPSSSSSSSSSSLSSSSSAAAASLATSSSIPSSSSSGSVLSNSLSNPVRLQSLLPLPVSSYKLSRMYWLYDHITSLGVSSDFNFNSHARSWLRGKLAYTDMASRRNRERSIWWEELVPAEVRNRDRCMYGGPAVPFIVAKEEEKEEKEGKKEKEKDVIEKKEEKELQHNPVVQALKRASATNAGLPLPLSPPPPPPSSPPPPPEAALSSAAGAYPDAALPHVLAEKAASTVNERQKREKFSIFANLRSVGSPKGSSQPNSPRGSCNASSTMPLGFEDVLSSYYLRNEFHQHLEENFSSASLDFVVAVEQWKNKYFEGRGNWMLVGKHGIGEVKSPKEEEDEEDRDDLNAIKKEEQECEAIERKWNRLAAEPRIQLSARQKEMKSRDLASVETRRKAIEVRKMLRKRRQQIDQGVNSNLTMKFDVKLLAARKIFNKFLGSEKGKGMGSGRFDKGGKTGKRTGEGEGVSVSREMTQKIRIGLKMDKDEGSGPFALLASSGGISGSSNSKTKGTSNVSQASSNQANNISSPPSSNSSSSSSPSKPGPIRQPQPKAQPSMSPSGGVSIFRSDSGASALEVEAAEFEFGDQRHQRGRSGAFTVGTSSSPRDLNSLSDAIAAAEFIIRHPSNHATANHTKNNSVNLTIHPSADELPDIPPPPAFSPGTESMLLQAGVPMADILATAAVRDQALGLSRGKNQNMPEQEEKKHGGANHNKRASSIPPPPPLELLEGVPHDDSSPENSPRERGLEEGSDGEREEGVPIGAYKGTLLQPAAIRGGNSLGKPSPASSRSASPGSPDDNKRSLKHRFTSRPMSSSPSPGRQPGGGNNNSDFSVKEDVFDGAVKEVTTYLHDFLWPQFVESEEYAQLVEEKQTWDEEMAIREEVMKKEEEKKLRREKQKTLLLEAQQIEAIQASADPPQSAGAVPRPSSSQYFSEEDFMEEEDVAAGVFGRRNKPQGWFNTEGYQSLIVDLYDFKGYKPAAKIYFLVSVDSTTLKTRSAIVANTNYHRHLEFALNITTQFVEVSSWSASGKFLGFVAIPVYKIQKQQREVLASGGVIEPVWFKLHPQPGSNEVVKTELNLKLSLSVAPPGSNDDEEEVTQVYESENQNAALADAIRGKVSKKKKRFQQDGFDLDLSYVTERIIAMGYPSEGTEGMYRNHMKNVQRFFHRRHPKAYRLYNLCSERSYDPVKFEGSVSCYPFDDHNPPLFETIKQICEDIRSWMAEHPQNVAAIHCKAGKGRTGTVIACYLVYAGAVKSASDALSLFAERRTKNKKGVTIPSQIRYVHYFEKYCTLKRLSMPNPGRATLFLQYLRLHTIPKVAVGSELDIYFTITLMNNSKDKESDLQNQRANSLLLPPGEQPHFTSSPLSSFPASLASYCSLKSIVPVFDKETKILTFDLTGKVFPLNEDIRIEFVVKTGLGGKQKLFQMWLNTRFIEFNSTTLTSGVVVNNSKLPNDSSSSLPGSEPPTPVESEPSSPTSPTVASPNPSSTTSSTSSSSSSTSSSSPAVSSSSSAKAEPRHLKGNSSMPDLDKPVEANAAAPTKKSGKRWERDTEHAAAWALSDPVLNLYKKDMDKACKDTKHKNYSSQIRLECVFANGLVRTVKEEELSLPQRTRLAVQKALEGRPATGSMPPNASASSAVSVGKK